jgi:hypothetical protein
MTEEQYVNFFEAAGLHEVEIGPGPLRFFEKEGEVQRNGHNLAALKAELVEAKETHASLYSLLAGLKAEFDSQVASLAEQFNSSNSELILNSDLAAQNVDRLERELKAAIVETYKAKLEAAKAAGENPEKVSKQFGDGLSVQNRKKFEYLEADAVAWARENANYMIQTAVDKKLFEKAMDNLETAPDFVKITKVPSAVISFK